jgi:hypothetical protein
MTLILQIALGIALAPIVAGLIYLVLRAPFYLLSWWMALSPIYLGYRDAVRHRKLAVKINFCEACGRKSSIILCKRCDPVLIQRTKDIRIGVSVFAVLFLTILILAFSGH